MTYYPTQLDEIDQWLFDSFGIVAGACSSTENLRYNTAKMVAEALLKRDQVEGPSRDQVDKLEEAAEDYAKDETMAGLAERAFKAGANWQREQLRDLCYRCEKDYDNVFFKGEQHAIKMMKEEAIEASCFGGKKGEEHIVTFVVPYFRIKDLNLGDKAKVYFFKDNKE